MLYPYMSFEDGTEVTHSSMNQDGTVKVCIETPVWGGFKNVIFSLPSYEILEESGFVKAELENWKAFVQANAHLMLGYAKEGGFPGAAAV